MDTRGFSVKSGRKLPPQIGPRAILHKLTRINLGKSALEQRHDHYCDILNITFQGSRNIVVVASKNGTGKTTISMLMAAVLGDIREKGGVIAVDFDYHGTLGSRAPGPTQGNVEEVASHTKLMSTNDLHAQMQTNGRLHVLAARRDHKARVLMEEDYNRVLKQAQSKYNFTFIDTAGFKNTHMDHVQLSQADAVVVVTSPAKDAADKTYVFLDILREKYAQKLSRTLVVINNPKKGELYIDPAKMYDKFSGEYNLQVLEFPFDEHLAEAGEINRKLLAPPAKWQALRIAAALVELTLRGTAHV